MWMLGFLVLVIYLPIFIFWINSDFRKRFSEVNSFGRDQWIEVIIGLLYGVIIINGFMLNLVSSLFEIISGALIYLFGLAMTFRGYWDFYSNDGLITSGIFARVRNPTYVFGFVAVVGIVLMTKALGMFIAVAILFLLTHRIILNEEKALGKKYGKKYEQYKKKVPRYF